MKCPQCGVLHPITAVAPEGLVCADCGSSLEGDALPSSAAALCSPQAIRCDGPHQQPPSPKFNSYGQTDQKLDSNGAYNSAASPAPDARAVRQTPLHSDVSTAQAELTESWIGWKHGLAAVATMAMGQYFYLLAFQYHSRSSLIIATVLTVGAIGIALLFGGLGRTAPVAASEKTSWATQTPQSANAQRPTRSAPARFPLRRQRPRVKVPLAP